MGNYTKDLKVTERKKERKKTRNKQTMKIRQQNQVKRKWKETKGEERTGKKGKTTHETCVCISPV